MGFRTVIIKNRAKLEFRLNYLVVRGESEVKIFISEINTVIIQSTAVSLTAALVSELIRRNIKVIFCDEKCSPCGEILPYYGAHNSTKRYKQQFNWPTFIKDEVWQKIITKKILAQREVLLEKGFLEQAEMLNGYAKEVVLKDVTNREGHAAKVYFNCILGDGVSRGDNCFINTCLNYGYSILLSAFNREIIASGYLTQLGIWHDNEFNQFNLSCDFMEPLRPIVDKKALLIAENDKDFKKQMISVLESECTMDGKNTTLEIAIKSYVKSIFKALEECNAENIVFPENIIIKNEL